MSFQSKKVTCDLIKWIAECFEQNGKGCTAVIGISGGKDSSIAAALCVHALGKERVLGVLMPNGTQQDIEDSKALCRYLGIRSLKNNIQKAYQNILQQLGSSFTLTEQSKNNLAPR